MSTGLLTAPAYRSVPPSTVGSMLPVVERFAAKAGRILEPEQCLAIETLTGVDADGLWAAPTGCIVMPRQNGKSSGVLAPIVLSELFDSERPDKIVWTAHRFKTSSDAFLDIEGMIRASDELSSRVEHWSYSHGEESIELDSGAKLEFLARSRMQGRGLGGKLVVLDEGFALQAGMLGALIPTLSARPDPLVLVGSSACMADSEQLYELVQDGRSGRDPGLSYIEWCARGSLAEPGCEIPGCMHTRGTAGCSLDSEERRAEANPAYGGRVTRRFVDMVERRRMSPLEFCRERLGWHEEPDAAGTPPVSVADWRNQIDPESAIAVDAPIVISVEIPLSRRHTAIGVAGHRDDGQAHVGLIDYLPGVDGALARILELAGKHTLHKIRRGPPPKPGKRDERRLHPAIIIDPTSPAGSLVDPLREAGFDPVLMTAAEVGASCAGLQDGLTQRTVWHRGSALVDIAIEGAVKRDLGDGNWAFGRKKSAAMSVDVAPVVVLAQARWGLTVAKKTYNLLDSFL